MSGLSDVEHVNVVNPGFAERMGAIAESLIAGEAFSNKGYVDFDYLSALLEEMGVDAKFYIHNDGGAGVEGFCLAQYADQNFPDAGLSKKMPVVEDPEGLDSESRGVNVGDALRILYELESELESKNLGREHGWAAASGQLKEMLLDIAEALYEGEIDDVTNEDLFEYFDYKLSALIRAEEMVSFQELGALNDDDLDAYELLSDEQKEEFISHYVSRYSNDIQLGLRALEDVMPSDLDPEKLDRLSLMLQSGMVGELDDVDQSNLDLLERYERARKNVEILRGMDSGFLENYGFDSGNDNKPVENEPTAKSGVISVGPESRGGLSEVFASAGVAPVTPVVPNEQPSYTGAVLGGDAPKLS